MCPLHGSHTCIGRIFIGHGFEHCTNLAEVALSKGRTEIDCPRHRDRVVPARVHVIERIVLTVEIRRLIQFGIPADEASDLWIVRPRADVQEAGIAPVLVARGA